MSVDCPPAVTAPGPNDAVTPAGTPLALSCTVSASPVFTAVFTVVVAEAPAVTGGREAGAAEREKSFAGAVPPPVKGAKMCEKSQVFCWMPEQLSAAPPPAQLPLSRWSAQKEERCRCPACRAQS
ncbi:hypothetical protein SVIOM342S_09923 [Streptomyces violaceorubidus]